MTKWYESDGQLLFSEGYEVVEGSSDSWIPSTVLRTQRSVSKRKDMDDIGGQPDPRE